MSLWSRKSLIEFVDLVNRPNYEPMTHAEITAVYRDAFRRTEQAVQELAAGVKVEKWKIPTTADLIRPGQLYSVAATMAYGTKFDQYPKSAQVDYLCHADAGGANVKSFAYLHHTPSISDDLYRHLMSDAAPVPQTPDALRVEAEAVELAYAFYKQMLAQTGTMLHLLGEYRMTKTGIDLIDDLKLAEIRMVITPAGLWLSAIFPDGGFAPAWWGPDGDNLIFWGTRYSWIFRTFCACLWYDLHAETEYVFHVSRDRPSHPAGRPREEKVIQLPKTVRKLEWQEGMAHDWGSGGRKGHDVRAHYRLLHEGWQASRDAIDNAALHGFPEPPDGYTFVSAYTVGDAPEARPPRIVARGLRVAQVALARL